MQHIDVLSIGEAMIDFISDTEQASLSEQHSFSMHPGGEAMNVATNVARLGGSTALVARVGSDAFGIFVLRQLEAAGVDTSYVYATPAAPTTLSVVTRHTTKPDFIIYRGADALLQPGDLPTAVLPNVSLVHTSTFAISREPSHSTILAFMKQAHEAGCLLSFDPNYHPSIWDIDEQPLSVFKHIYPHIFVTKPSFDDCARLFGEGKSPEAYAAYFLEMGAKYVILTMGAHGTLLAEEHGCTFFSAPDVKVVDVTGAGDSFWSGLLMAVLDGYSIKEAVEAARAVAAIKLRQVGPLTQSIDRASLYAELHLGKP